MKKRLKLKALEAAARDATRNALSAYTEFAKVPTDDLTLGTLWEGDIVIFELYIAKDRPQDAVVITTAKVDSYSGEIVDVQVHENALRALAQQSVAADRREDAASAER